MLASNGPDSLGISPRISKDGIQWNRLLSLHA